MGNVYDILSRRSSAYVYVAVRAMKHPINPKVDCVFKALLGADENRDLLIHFLNAVLLTDLDEPITSVDIINPYNEREFLDDKLSVVDVKARDSRDRLIQIEIQISVHQYLQARMLYTWADLYTQQIKSGDDFGKLRPTYSIWLLSGNMFGDAAYWREFQMQTQDGLKLVQHGSIWVLELPKYESAEINNERERWVRFFNEGSNLDDETLPGWMQTDEMRQAMKTLKSFSEKERQYHAYQARENYLREQSCIQKEREEAQAKIEEIQAKMKEERRLKDAALRVNDAKSKEIEQLKDAKSKEIEQLKDAKSKEIEQLKEMLKKFESRYGEIK